MTSKITSKKKSDTSYLFYHVNNVWMFQIYIPSYLRPLFGGRRAYRKSTGTSDLQQAQRFRDHLLLEFNELKARYKPDDLNVRLSNCVSDLRRLTDNHYVSENIELGNGVKLETNRISVIDSSKSNQYKPTLKNVLCEYLDSYRERRKPSTLSKIEHATNLFIKGKSNLEVNEITRTMVTQFIKQHIHKNSPQTVQGWVSSLSAVYEYALRSYDLINAQNPFKNHNLEARRAVKNYEPFKPEQITALLENANKTIRNLILIALFTGCRLDEIASLKRTDIKVINGITCLHISHAKTEAGIRYIPLHRTIKQIVSYYLSEHSGDYLLPESNKINRTDGKKGAWYSQNFTRLRRKTLPETNTEKNRQCFHSFRGHFITALDRLGVPEQRIASITGHMESKAKTEAFRTYSQGADLDELNTYINMLPDDYYKSNIILL
ncbi:tyrosine-type recombinase/integrase [Plesiomonas shigelloides]|uniref:tyrosine-type recombinase/integrase n=1 Tax=Plesiomonas shigelloides TaxID=703 RepID=UPI000A11B65F|nr:tyrosine-type recombinase/integrase [Plesiomonas shigelloides]